MTVAATTPVAAANNVPTSTTAAATPPLMGPRSIPMALRSRSARPDRSRMAPIKTKNGTANNVESDTAPNHRPGRTFSAPGSNVLVRSPMNENSRAVAANENATL